MSSAETIQCASHGEAHGCFVCSHLLKRPEQHWFSNLALPDNRHPDAWCRKCEDIRQAKDGWENVEDPPIKLICNHCYSDKRSKSVDSLKGVALKQWQQLVQEACEELSSKQEKLVAKYCLSHHERWDYDQTTGLLTFSNDGKLAVEAEFQIIGSVSKELKTWQWAWSNPNWVQAVTKKVQKVADFGFEHGYPMLTVPVFDADEHDGWHLAMLATQLMKAKGIYRIPGEHTFLFLAITKIRSV
jgi:hypothetical protein